MNELLEKFRASVEAFLVQTEMKPSAFGRAAVNDSRFVTHLREGAVPTLGRMDKVREYMRVYSDGMAERAAKVAEAVEALE